MAGRLTQNELESISQGPPGRRWLLLEAPFAGMYEGYTAAADEPRERGFAVVVGHPERAAPDRPPPRPSGTKSPPAALSSSPPGRSPGTSAIRCARSPGGCSALARGW
jgi:hypothetical protein